MPATTPQILVVDDDEGLLILMAEALRGDGFRVTTADSGKAALAWLKEHRPDLMILDLKLKDVDGRAVVEELQGRAVPVPFVIVTGQGDEKVAVEVMKQGALDYVMKDTGLIDLLPTVVRRALAAVGREHALATAQAEHQRLEHEIVAAGERERQSIGEDLHDGLGQQLTAIELLCAGLKEDAAAYPDLARRIDQASKMLREAIAQTRSLARGLVPVGNDPEALQMGLMELAGRITAVGRVECRFESKGNVEFPASAAASHLYRIAQEAINNALKHAKARQVVVRLIRETDALILEVADDGKGLPTRRVGAGATGMGLGVMQHRANVIGGELTISSKRGEGVLIRCRLPIKK